MFSLEAHFDFNLISLRTVIRIMFDHLAKARYSPTILLYSPTILLALLSREDALPIYTYGFLSSAPSFNPMLQLSLRTLNPPLCLIQSFFLSYLTSPPVSHSTLNIRPQYPSPSCNISKPTYPYPPSKSESSPTTVVLHSSLKKAHSPLPSQPTSIPK